MLITLTLLEPNAGKSLLARFIAWSSLNYKTLQQSQNSPFMFAELMDAKVCLHEEALYAKVNFEYFKLLMEGIEQEVQ